DPELAHDLSGRPRDRRLNARHGEPKGLAEIDPAIFVMLGTSELGANRQLDLLLPRARDVVASDFAAGIRRRLVIVVPPGELEIVDAGLLRRLAHRCIERLLAGLDHALRTIPV